MAIQDVLDGYQRVATSGLVARYEAISSDDVFQPVIEWLPSSPVRLADIGAGTGRDAAWFARQGHLVTAVEPVAALRNVGETLHANEGIAWIDDRLPALSKLAKEPPFGCITMCGVWQHLDDNARLVAWRVLARLLETGGRLLLSLRHGPGGEGRRVFPVSVEKSVEFAMRSGLNLRHRAEAESVQAGNRALGVNWTWLVLEKAR